MNKLPEVRPVKKDELRRMWADPKAEDVRRLTLEVERYRRVMEQIDAHHRSIQQVWREEVGGHLVALHMLRVLLQEERDRLGG